MRKPSLFSARGGSGVAGYLTQRGLGGWPASMAPATYHNGTTYIGTGTGSVRWRSYNQATGVISAPTEVGLFGPDWHNCPVMVVRAADSKIVTVYCDHNAAAIYCRISTNAEDVSAWGSATNLDAALGGTAYTYPYLTQLTGESDTLYLFYRDYAPYPTAVLCYSTSVDGGATWSAQTALYKNTDMAAYWYIVSNGTDRIDILTTDGTSEADYASIYHFYMTGGALYQSDGTEIVGALPLHSSDLTEAYDGAANGSRGVVGASRVGSTIVAVHPVYITGDEGYRYTRWNGSTWSTYPVADAGRLGDPWVEGGIDVDPADVDSVLLSRYVGTAWQVFDYRTVDGGSSWTSTQLTFGGDSTILPHFVVGHAEGLRALALNGTAFSYQNYSFAIVGLP